MRFAVLIAPNADIARAHRRGESDAPHATEDARLRDRLARAGFELLVVRGSRDLLVRVEQSLPSFDVTDSLLCYISGATKLTSDGMLALDLGDGSRLGVHMIAATLRARGARAGLFVIDLAHDGLAIDGLRATEHVEAAIRAVGAREHGAVAIVHAQALAAFGAEGPWRLTQRFVDAIDERVAADDRLGSSSTIYARLRETREGDAPLDNLAFVPGDRDFFVLGYGTGGSSPPSRNTVRNLESAPPSLRALAALPALEPLLAAATDARMRGAWDDAIAAYKKALMIVDAEAKEDAVFASARSAADDARSRASIYANMGEVKRAQGKPREAETNFEKALAESPLHKRSFNALIDLATEAKDWTRVVAYRRKRLGALTDDAARFAELEKIAMVLEEQAGDDRSALAALEEARALRPTNAGILDRMRVVAERVGAWPQVVEILELLAEQSSDPVQKSEFRFLQADIVLSRLRDEARGLALLDKSIQYDPTNEKAISALVAVRTRREEYKPLARSLARLVDRYAERFLVDRAWDMCKRLAILRRDKLGDVPGAIEALDGALRCKPQDADSRAMLAELLLARGDMKRALRELETASVYAPTRAGTHRRLFELHARAGRNDRAWLAATALQELGAASVDHQLLIDQFRPEGGIRPNASLDGSAWDAWLRAPGADPLIAGILRAILPAAVTMRIEELRDAGQLMQLDPSRKQDPRGTVTVVRAFAWAAQVLSLPLPDLYAMDDVPGGLAAAQVAFPSTAIGASVLSGLAQSQLAFVVGRHLTYYRPEHYALVFYPTLAETSALVLAAVKVVMGHVPVAKPVEDLARRMAGVFERRGNPEERAQLRDAVEELDDRGGRMDVGSWIRSVELTAARAGLVLAGDLRVATEQLRSESRSVGGLTLDDKRGDLLTFCASPGFAAIREMLGIAAASSSSIG